MEYLDLMRKILDHGESHSDRTGTGTLSLFGEQIRFDLRKGFPLLTTKKVHYKSLLYELRWFLNGDTNVKYLQDNGVTIWDEWATKEQCAKFGRAEGELGRVYGAQWRGFGHTKVDQIKRLVDGLQLSPESRRHIVTGWHPEDAPRVELPPCHTLFQCKVHHRSELSLHLYARSIDTFLGLPFNIASYAMLTELLAHVCNYKTRELIISFGDVHIYNNHFDQCSEQLIREPKAPPKIHLPDELRGGGFEALMKWEPEDVVIEGYDPHPAIKAEVSV